MGASVLDLPRFQMYLAACHVSFSLSKTRAVYIFVYILLEGFLVGIQFIHEKSILLPQLKQILESTIDLSKLSIV